MEAAPKQAPKVAGRHSSSAASRRKCTGEPISDEPQAAPAHTHGSGGGGGCAKPAEERKKLAQLFSKSTSSFLTRSSKFLDSLHLAHQQQQQQQQQRPAPKGVREQAPSQRSAAAGLSSSAASSASSSSDDWQLLSPTDCEEEDEADQGARDQNMRLERGHLSSPGRRREQQQQQQQQQKCAQSDNNNDSRASNANYASAEPALQSRALVHLCACLYALVPLASLASLLALLALLGTRLWPLALAYFVQLALDRNACNRGGRRLKAVYESPFWAHLAAYFPIKLRYARQLKLDPNENYILNYHPHGIAAFGCVASFATDALNFSKLFPGLTARFMVHETSFLVPLMREIFLLRGDCSVSSRSFDYILDKKWRQPSAPQATGNLLALVGGGLAEADLSEPETLKVVVATRKGFVRKALLHGAHLIPCIAFGENSVFTKLNFEPNSLMARLEAAWYRLFKFKHPLYYGRSMLAPSSKLRGALPYKRPITVVMGEPIRVERAPEPTQQQVDELHARYLRQLEQLYAANQDLCSSFDRRMQLV